MGQRTNLRIGPIPITAIDEHGWMPMKHKPAARQPYGRTETARWTRHPGIAMRHDRLIGMITASIPASRRRAGSR